MQISGPRHLVLARSRSVRTVKTTIPFPDSLTHLVDIDTAALGPGLRVRPAQVQVFTWSPHHIRRVMALMRILGIETSCDETSAAVLEGTRRRRQRCARS